jgi:hypothetical protein
MRMRSFVSGILMASLVWGVATFVHVSRSAPRLARAQVYDVYLGQGADFVGMDWFCSHTRSKGARIVVCGRNSTFAGVGTEVTSNWLRVFKYPSTKNGLKVLLYEHQRNP